MFLAAGYAPLVKLKEITKIESDDRALLGHSERKLLIVVAR